MKVNKSKLRVGLIVLNVIALVGLSSLSLYLYNEKKNAEVVLGLSTEEKNQKLVDEINEVYDLPDEQPIVAVVTDPEQFKAEYPAFDDAQSGDYLLFFRKARLNVLYRQDEKKVIKTANVNVPISVELIGSQSAIEDAEEKLADFGNQITVTKVVRDGVTQAFVFDVDSDQSAEAQSIADQLDIDVGSTLPDTIVPSEQTEIVIVVAKEKLPLPAPENQQTP